jgi:hypothetical protein
MRAAPRGRGRRLSPRHHPGSTHNRKAGRRRGRGRGAAVIDACSLRQVRTPHPRPPPRGERKHRRWGLGERRCRIKHGGRQRGSSMPLEVLRRWGERKRRSRRRQRGCETRAARGFFFVLFFFLQIRRSTPEGQIHVGTRTKPRGGTRLVNSSQNAPRGV